MPVIKSAIKKLRKDRKREKSNDALRASLDNAVRDARKSPSKISKAFSIIDRAIKKNLIHANRGARMKMSLGKLAKPTTKTTKAAPKKSTLKATPSKKTSKKIPSK